MVRGFSGYGGRPIRARFMVPLEVGVLVLVGIVGLVVGAPIVDLLGFCADGILLALLLVIVVSSVVRSLDSMRYTPTELRRAGGYSPVLKWLGLAVCGLAGGYAATVHSFNTQLEIVATALVVLLNIDAGRIHLRLGKQHQ